MNPRLAGVGLAFFALLLVVTAPRRAYAHPSQFGVAHYEVVDGVGDLFVRIPRQSLGDVELRPVMSGCNDVEMRVVADTEASALRWRGHCDEHAAEREVGFAALPDNLEIYLSFSDGRRVRLTSDMPATNADGTRGSGFIELGVEHIAFGWDHLLFVLGLWLLAGGFTKRLFGVITAFTLGHSLTLAAASLGEFSVDVWLVEALIAGSIVLLGREALMLGRRQRTWTQRYPASVAAAFGLVHGLGFAGALKENGLPEGERLSALFGFNLGVELGQLVFVLGLSALAYLMKRIVPAPRFRSALAYGVGGGGAYALLLQLL